MCLTLIKGIFPEHLKYTCMQILWMLHGYPVFDCSPIFSNALHVLSFSRTSVTFTSISSGGMVVLFRNAKSCFKKDENSIKPLQCTWWCVNCIICHTNNNVELQKDSRCCNIYNINHRQSKLMIQEIKSLLFAG